MNIGGAIRIAYVNAIMKTLTKNPQTDMNEADTIGEDAIYRVALEKLRLLSC